MKDKRLRGLSYVQKTVIPYLILLVISLIGIALIMSNFFETFVLDEWENELVTEARLITDRMSLSPSNDLDGSHLNALAEKYGEMTHNRVTLILADGSVVGDSEHDIANMDNHLDRPEVLAALNGMIQPSIRMSATLHERLIYVATPVMFDGELVGFVRLAKSLSNYDQVLSRFRSLLFWVAGIILLCSILLMVIQSTRWLNPLRKISEKIHASTEGELRVIEGKERRDEIGLVVAAHNAQVEKSRLQIQALQNERTKLSAILFHMTDGVILIDAEGTVTLINPAAGKMFNIQVEALEDASLIEVARQHQIVELWQQTLKTGKPQTTTFQTSLEKESIQVVSSLLGSELPGEVLLLFQDLTLIHKLETVRKDFVSNISHELRTPLASLKALSETLQAGALKDVEVSNRFLRQMDDEIDNLSQMVQELLELAKIESGRVPVKKTTSRVDEIITPPVERMRLQAERSGVTIETAGLPSAKIVEVDLVRIQQVLVNLIHNAVKFTPPGGKIRVEVAEHKNELVISIADTGVGIPHDDLERIFERFYKSDRSRSSGGTGLGLSISRHIIEAHGGRIWAESIQGKGSTFYFSIPACT